MELFTFLGRLHPMVVHLPIGFLLLASAFDLLSYSAMYRHLRNAIAPALFAGFISAAVACIFGYLLSLDGSYDEDILEHHRNAGIVLAVASAMWWAMVTTWFSNYATVRHRYTTVFGFVVVVVLGYTGHQGGSLTHGSDYLSLIELEKPKRAKPPTTADALVFDDVVLPILERKCERCHRRGKRKGDLIVSSYADLMKGGEDGVVVVAGSLENSELYRRITLDPEHKDFMPTDGRKPLTREETDVIKWWIGKAQAAYDRKIASIEGHEEILPVVAALVGLDEGRVVNTRPPNPDIPMSTDMGAIDNLRKKGMMVRVMLHAPVMLDITLPAHSGIGMNALQNDLRSVARNVVWLNLADNDLVASDLIILKEMSNLEKLRLERNPVDDNLIGILDSLKHLEALNINDTRVTDRGFLKLKEHPSLKRIFRWNSRLGVAE
jgi:uncharacterized membrane protein